jgi:hypothetical protein
MLQVHRHADARAFLARAEPWLLREELTHAELLGSAYHARADDSHYERPIYWATIEDGGEIVGCAYRTPPYRVGVTALPATAIAPLLTNLADTYATVSGFAGDNVTATALATAWIGRRGGSWSVNTRQQLLALAAPVAHTPTEGTLRLAGSADIGLAQSWGAAVSLDSGIAALDGAFCAQLLAAKRLYFWVDDQPRCMLGLLRENRQWAALGVVYTPAAYRNRGRASAAVMALQELLLERGVRDTYLYIDPANDAALALSRKLHATVIRDTIDIDC